MLYITHPASEEKVTFFLAIWHPKQVFVVEVESLRCPLNLLQHLLRLVGRLLVLRELLDRWLLMLVLVKSHGKISHVCFALDGSVGIFILFFEITPSLEIA